MNFTFIHNKQRKFSNQSNGNYFKFILNCITEHFNMLNLENGIMHQNVSNKHIYCMEFEWLRCLLRILS